MSNYKRSNGNTRKKFNNHMSSEDKSSYGSRDRSSKSYRSANQAMFKATCANCGNECEVPFKPSGSRPILCSNCFKSSKSEYSNNSENRFTKKSYGNDKNLKINTLNDSRIDDLKTQINALSNKLDRIFDLLKYGSLKNELKGGKKLKQDVKKVDESTPIQTAPDETLREE